MKFHQSLPLIYVLALVTSKFHQKLQLKFQSSNLRFDLEGHCNGRDCKTQMIKMKVGFFCTSKEKRRFLAHF